MKPMKIAALGLEDVVTAGINAGKNPQQIADDCTRKAGQPISNMAVRRFIEAMEGSASVMTAPVKAESAKPPDKRRERAVKEVPERVHRLVERDIDLIELQYQTTAALADRFAWIANLPDTFDARMRQLHDLVTAEGTDTTTLDHWGLAFTLELRRNIGNMAVLNREIRQNGQFMATLREKAFEFNLIQEYLHLFMEEFRKENAGAFEIAEQRVASNPRMQRIVEQQQQMRGFEQA
ncbi:hypothetical protein [Cohnella sp. JJ-181]|uniref:hypothetical protein n=1 Tax=Cohnella rhizoplanae TaxID=2974897 RepID=UPI0022FF892E|nr:hypothetical protein [Cohnella sp. JJ-181]CAI6073394.1 hypothetical protein COHCIP112018_02384 [Cohnella sp. JJ-181]